MKVPLLPCSALLLALVATDVHAQAARTFVLPHILERSGRVTSGPRTLDYDIHFVSLDRVPVELYLFESATGQPLKSRTGADVCNPCTVDFTRSPKQVVSIEERILAAGGFPRPVVQAYATLNSKGSKTLSGVAVQAFLINANTGPLDLSVFGFEPQPIAAAAP